MTLTATRRRGPETEAPHPKVAARRRAVRAKASRPRRLLLIAAAVVSLLGAMSWPLLHSGLFSARVLVVSGNRHTPTAAVLRVAGLSTHPAMINVHAGAAERSLDALPWVANATVALQWPDGVTVRVRERRPVAAVAAGTGWAEVDEQGRVLALAAAPPAGLVHLVGVGRPGRPGTTLTRAGGPLKVAATLPVALAPLVTALAPARGGVDLSLSDGVGVILGAPGQLPAKFEDVASILAGAHLAAGSVIDVTVPQSPAVAPPAPAGGAR